MSFEQNKISRFATVDDSATFTAVVATVTGVSHVCGADTGFVSIANDGAEKVYWSTGAAVLDPTTSGQPLAAGTSTDVPVTPGTTFWIASASGTSAVNLVEVKT